MNKSETINEIAKAMSIFQGEVDNAKKTAENPFFKSSYADLAEIWDTIRPSLAKNGLSIIQIPSAEGQKVKITTLATHLSGQWIEGELEITATKGDPQAIGSAITYGRRYALAAFCGIAQKDDDGNEASISVKGDPRKDQKPDPKSNPDDPRIEQIKTALMDYINSGKLTPDGATRCQNAIDNVFDVVLLERILAKAKTAHDSRLDQDDGGRVL